ncbi:hypothetical protein HanRHA438_Chr05g0204451 [Helianthus annuus]|nr:hypothetical protein HanRHA438_Chr05g0204451 [Helianthus annuus]
MESNNHTLRLVTAMATTHYTAEQASATVRFMCSFGGKILPRPHDNQLRYVGGDTRIVTVLRHSTTYASLLSKLSKLSGTTDICVKYQLPKRRLGRLDHRHE